MRWCPQERGSDAEGAYSVTNTTRAMAAVASNATSILGVPFLGGIFLSQKLFGNRL